MSTIIFVYIDNDPTEIEMVGVVLFITGKLKFYILTVRHVYLLTVQILIYNN